MKKQINKNDAEQAAAGPGRPRKPYRLSVLSRDWRQPLRKSTIARAARCIGLDPSECFVHELTETASDAIFVVVSNWAVTARQDRELSILVEGHMLEEVYEGDEFAEIIKRMRLLQKELALIINAKGGPLLLPMRRRHWRPA